MTWYRKTSFFNQPLSLFFLVYILCPNWMRIVDNQCWVGGSISSTTPLRLICQEFLRIVNELIQEANVDSTTVANFFFLYRVSTKEVVLYTPIRYLVFIYLAGFSGLLSGTSLSGLGFILVSMSTSVFINGHKDWFFNLFIHSNSYVTLGNFRHLLVTAPGLP